MKHLIVIAILSIVLTSSVFSQKTISGKIYDEDGFGVPGANVWVEGYKNIGTITDLEGHYILNKVPEDAKKLVVSFVGLKSVTTDIEGMVMDIMLPMTNEFSEEERTIYLSGGKLY